MTTSSGSRRLARLPDILFGLSPFFLIGIQLACGGGLSSRNWDQLKQEIRSKYPSVAVITTDELEEWLHAGEKRSPLLLDARSREEFDVSHLQDAKSAPSLPAALKALELFGDDRSIVVYCSVGYRSAALVEALQENGIQRTYNLEGSIFEWANQGRPVFRDGKQVREVHPYDSQWGGFLNRNLWSWRASEE